MKLITVKDLMLPLSDYPVVSSEATLKEAIQTLEEVQQKFKAKEYKHRAILVEDGRGAIIGKLSQLDVLRALEPKYHQIGQDTGQCGHFGLSRFGFSPKFMKTISKQYNLWNQPLKALSTKASEIKVKTFMYTPTEGEFVEHNAKLDEAIHQFVLGHHQSLLVTDNQAIVGILRLTDVFMEISNMIKTP